MELKRSMCVLALAVAAVTASTAMAASVSGTMYGAYSPVRESNTPEWNAWFNNASTAIVTGANNGGTGYEAYANILNGQGNGTFDVNGLMVTNQVVDSPVPPAGFNSWMGTADASGMYGNRFTFMGSLQGTALDIRNITVKRDTILIDKNSNANVGWTNTGDYSTDTVGFGTQAQDNRSGYNWNSLTSSWDEVTSGFIADRIIVTTSVGWNPDYIGVETNQQRLDRLEQQLLGNALWSGGYYHLSYDFQVSYSGASVVTGNVTAVPLPASAYTGLLGLALVAGLGLVSKLRPRLQKA